MKKQSIILLLTLTICVAAFGQKHFCTDFNEQQLGAEWQYLQQPDASKYVLHDGMLRLYGSPYNLKDHEPTTFLALPQTTPQFTAETSISFFDDESGDEAGMCVYLSDSCYVQLFINNNKGEHRLKLQFQLRSHQWLIAEKHLSRTFEKMWLRIACDSQYYQFFYSLDGQKFQLLDQIERLLLSPAIAGSNSLPLVGMFVFTGTTKYQTGYSYADFDFFDYRAQ